MTYHAPIKYTKKQLMRYILKDLITDYRCSKRDGMEEYGKECIDKIRTIFPNRNKNILNKYGLIRLEPIEVKNEKNK
jgi:hypothetical protein